MKFILFFCLILLGAQIIPVQNFNNNAFAKDSLVDKFWDKSGLDKEDFTDDGIKKNKEKLTEALDSPKVNTLGHLVTAFSIFLIGCAVVFFLWMMTRR